MKIFQKACYNRPTCRPHPLTFVDDHDDKLLTLPLSTISSPEPQAIGAEGHEGIHENFEAVQWSKIDLGAHQRETCLYLTVWCRNHRGGKQKFQVSFKPASRFVGLIRCSSSRAICVDPLPFISLGSQIQRARIQLEYFIAIQLIDGTMFFSVVGRNTFISFQYVSPVVARARCSHLTHFLVHCSQNIWLTRFLQIVTAWCDLGALGMS